MHTCVATVLSITFLFCGRLESASTSTRKCQLFKTNPRLRKIVKHYVHAKLFGDIPGDFEKIVFREHNFVENLILKVVPPFSR